MQVAGLVLAAGAGTRMGRPKALIRDASGTAWVQLAAIAMSAAGCSPVLVVTGARHGEVEQLVPASARPVHAAGWAEGMSVSLRTGLNALAGLPDPVQAVVVGLVDMPDVGGDLVARLRAAADGPQSLARAAYRGRPGHPVLLGRDHWAAVADTARGDAGARHYLRGRTDVRLIEVGDLASGVDLDTPQSLARGTDR